MARKIVDIQLEGFEELSKKFNGLDEKIKRKALKPSIRKGSNIIRDAARRLVPIDEGDLMLSIRVKPLKKRAQFGLTVQTGTAKELSIKETKGRGYYPFSIEYGTKHIRARPYMRPALENNRQKAIKAIGEELGKRIEKLAKQ